MPCEAIRHVFSSCRINVLEGNLPDQLQEINTEERLLKERKSYSNGGSLPWLTKEFCSEVVSTSRAVNKPGGKKEPFYLRYVSQRAPELSNERVTVFGRDN